MDRAQVQLLLSVWESTVASLVACRDALAANEWNATRALASLEPQLVSTPALAHGQDPAKKLLGRYKERARGYRDLSEGTLTRSMVWVTEHATRASPLVGCWDRHRYFLGAPVTRWLVEGDVHASRRSAGFVRLARSPAQATRLSAEQEAALTMRDACWIRDRLQAYAAASGTRIAVEISGHAGWLDAAGCDDELAPAFVSAHAPLTDPTALLDAHPDRRRDVPDCGWAPQWELALAIMERVLCNVDLVLDSESASDQTLRELEAAVASHVWKLVLHRFRYEAARVGSFNDILDRMVIEQGSQPIAEAWREVSRAEAHATLVSVLTTTQAYGRPVFPSADAERHASTFLSAFEAGAMFFRNGNGSSWVPVLNTTFEEGVAIIDGSAVGMFFVGDED